MEHYLPEPAAKQSLWQKLYSPPQNKRRRARSNRGGRLYARESAGLENLEPRVLLSAVAIDTVERISQLPNGSDLNGASIHASTSRDGRFVVFSSRATNLVAGDNNNSEDVFLLDRVTDQIELISVNSSEVQANLASLEPVITPDGRYVAFRSFATNLDGGAGGTQGNVFVRDRQSGTTSRVSFTGPFGGDGGHSASISDNGQTVVFLSEVNGATQVFLFDRAAGPLVEPTTLITQSLAFGVGNADSGPPVLTSNGGLVFFHTAASNLLDVNGDLIADDLNGLTDIYRWTRATGELEILVSGNGHSFNPDVSANGSALVFESDATNLINDDNNGRRDIFRVSGTGDNTGNAALISHVRGPNNQIIQGNGDSFTPSISDSGRFVAFATASSNFVSADADGTTDIYVADNARDLLILLSYHDDTREVGNGNSTMPEVSADGSLVVFSSVASNLHPGDANGVSDIFAAPTELGRSFGVDIAGQIISVNLPTSIVTGDSPRRSTLQVLITNEGTGPAATGQRIDVQVFLRPLSGGPDLLVGEVEHLSISNLDPGRSRSVNVNLDIPTTLPSGDYQIFTVIDSNREVLGETDFGDSTLFANQQLMVANAFIDLEPELLGEMPTVLVPGDRLRQQVLIHNDGNVEVRGMTLVRLLASTDTIADPGDIVLDQRELRLRANPDKPTKVNFNVRSLPDLPEGEFFFIVDVQPLEGDPLLVTATDIVGVSGDQVQVLNQFGSVGDRDRVKLTLSDDAGEPVTFSFSGPGSGMVIPVGGNVFDLNLTGTNERTRLDIRSKGDGVIIRNITSDNSIGTLGAKKGINLTGAININGSANNITFDDISGASINITGSLDKLTADVVTDMNLLVGSMIDSVTVGTWEGGSLTTGSLKSIRANSSRDTGTGDLHLDVTLIGPMGIQTIRDVKATKGDIGGNWLAAGGLGSVDAGSLTGFNANFAGGADRIRSRGDVTANLNFAFIDDLRVDGDLSSSQVLLTQGVSDSQPALKKLTVRGLIEDTMIRTAGHIDNVTAGAMVDSNIFAGIDPAETGLPDSAADFVNPAVIANVQLRGVSGRNFDYQRSNIAADAFGRVRLGDVDPSNGGTPFGLATRTFDLIDYVLGDERISAKNNDLASLVNQGDFVVRVL